MQTGHDLIDSLDFHPPGGGDTHIGLFILWCGAGGHIADHDLADVVAEQAPECSASELVDLVGGAVRASRLDPEIAAFARDYVRSDPSTGYLADLAAVSGSEPYFWLDSEALREALFARLDARLDAWREVTTYDGPRVIVERATSMLLAERLAARKDLAAFAKAADLVLLHVAAALADALEGRRAVEVPQVGRLEALPRHARVGVAASGARIVIPATWRSRFKFDGAWSAAAAKGKVHVPRIPRGHALAVALARRLGIADGAPILAELFALVHALLGQGHRAIRVPYIGSFSRVVRGPRTMRNPITNRETFLEGSWRDELDADPSLVARLAPPVDDDGDDDLG